MCRGRQYRTIDFARTQCARLDEKSRKWKAQKIAILSGITQAAPGTAMLDIGTGSGYIAAFFSRMGFGESGTFAIDVEDGRRVHSGYQFILASAIKLPFPDQRFDFIISNHVIEHVGHREHQRAHLAEVTRCLRDGGRFYIAVPNRWGLWEPHYRLLFLSWLPRWLANRYARLSYMRPAPYDCYPLSRRELVGLLRQQGLDFEEVTLQAIRLVGDIEETRYLPGLIFSLPVWFWRLHRSIVPTLIFVCRKQSKRVSIGQINSGKLVRRATQTRQSSRAARAKAQGPTSHAGIGAAPP
jgi:ubiquinone/menaquinone biosynthesis C-methylase UbiE